MVAHLFYIFLIIPFLLIAGEFTATVSQNQVNLTEGFTLKLTLKDASTNGQPALDMLQSQFHIHSQQKSQQTTYINGHMSSATIWTLGLLPLNEGQVTIPAISIDTAEGPMWTHPISLQVSKETPSAKAGSKGNELAIVTESSTIEPYKNEPVLFTVKLRTKQHLTNVRLDKFSVEDAIVESLGEPKISQTIVDGVDMGMIEFTHLITPLKPGPLKIPSATIHGSIITRRKARDDFDHFSMMLHGFEQAKPFAIRTEEVMLEVQPPVSQVSPWLPARSIKIEENWSEPISLRVGEPFTREIKIIAEGVKSTQLSNLNDLINSAKKFKIYSDHPELKDEIANGEIKSFRKENYTYIPQEAGIITLPEVVIDWWDVAHKRKMTARSPSRTLQVLPAPIVQRESNELAALDNNLALENNSAIKNTTAIQNTPVIELASIGMQTAPTLYWIIAALAGALLATLIWVICLNRKIRCINGTYRSKKAPSRSGSQYYSPFSDPELTNSGNRKTKRKLPDLNP